MLNWRFFVVVVVALGGCGGGGSSSRSTPPPPDPGPPPPPPTEFFCANDASCPELFVANDPPATDATGQPDAFRGYGDPDLEFDAATGTLWLSYSWLNVIESAGAPINPYRAVRTHLARSDDSGNTFEFVRAVNEPLIEQHPETGNMGWTRHEVSTLERDADGWQLLWVRAMDIPDDPNSGVFFRRSTAAAAADLGDNDEPVARGAATSAAFAVPVNLSELPELSDCSLFTEPSLYSDAGTTYLATNCVVFNGGEERLSATERLVLLREEGDAYSFVGTLTDAMDAADLGADRIEQAEITLSRDGTLLLIATPIVDDAEVQHQGCVVFEFTDIATAALDRDASGIAIPRAIVTADGNGIGPGLCSYRPESETGLLLVITKVPPLAAGVEFSLRATGFHP